MRTVSIDIDGNEVLFDIEGALLFVGISLFVGTNGYVQCKRRRAYRYVHRVITGAKPEDLVDHINGNPLDNRSSNLRICDHSQNGFNKRTRKDSSTRISGVWWDNARMKWAVQIAGYGIRRNVGRYSCFFQACCARKSAELEMHGAYSSSLGVNS